MLHFYKVSFIVFSCLIGLSIAILRLPVQEGVQNTLSSAAELTDASSAVDDGRLIERDCHLGFIAPVTFECFWYYTRSDSDAVRLPVMVLRSNHTSYDTATGLPHEGEPLVFLTGGPGSGQNTSPDGALFWSDWFLASRMTRDLVVYDPRGNSPGSPAWDCDDYTAFSVAALTRDLSANKEAQLSESILQACFEEYVQYLVGTSVFDAPLQQFSSVQNAKDLNGLMASLGYAQWHALAVSYGTRVAMLAALENPNIKSLILDSPYPLNASLTEDEASLWNKAFAQFWQYCDALNVCAQGVLDSESLFWEVMNQLQKSPLDIRLSLEGRALTVVLNDNRLAAFIFAGLYEEAWYNELVPVLLALRKKQVDPIVPLVKFVLSNAFHDENNAMVYYATECNDAVENTVKGGVCDNPHFAPGSLPIMRTLGIPILIANGELDPITPLAQTMSMQRYLTDSQLFIAAGVGHGVLSSGLCGYEFLEPFLSNPQTFRRAVDSGEVGMGQCF